MNSVLLTIIQSPPPTHCSTSSFNILAACCLHQNGLWLAAYDDKTHPLRTYHHVNNDTIAQYFNTFIDWDTLPRYNAQKSYNNVDIDGVLSKKTILIRGGETNELEETENKSTKQIHSSASTNHNSLHQSQNKERLSWISPKRLWSVARNVLDRTTGILRFHRSSTTSQTQISGSDKDEDFDELDSIFDKTDNEDPIQDEERKMGSDETWLDSEPSPPEGASLLRSWNQRSLRSWINKVSKRVLCLYHSLAGIANKL